MSQTRISSHAVPSSGASSGLVAWSAIGAAAYSVYIILKNAYKIRMQAIEEYGPVIHEFDPYFNYRATEYLYEHGSKKFFQWFDHMVWYPLGRPVGTTIYPGMQFTAVAIKNFVLGDWSLNDICCYIPAWFGAIATFLVGMIAYECTIPENSNASLISFIVDVVQGKISNPPGTVRPVALGVTSPALECACFAMGMMAIVPAHIMRSVGGGYDNESIAMTAMTLTFYFWVRSLRTNDPYSWIFGILTGLAYFYMVAAWGGYIFVLNLIGVHAGLLVVMGRFSTKIYLAYSLFYAIGTALAVQIPVVGWTPLKSLEQLGPCAVFLGYQLIQVCEVIKRKQNLSRQRAWKLRIQVFAGSAIAAILIVIFLAPSGYFGPFSSRVRGLFVRHTRTGNPLVDSVAEHQPASGRAYFQYLHHVCSLAPLGYLMTFFNLSNSSSFLITWGTFAYFFSHKMVRLILLTAPIGSTLGGIAAGRLFAWCLRQWWDSDDELDSLSAPTQQNNSANGPSTSTRGGKEKKQKKGKRGGGAAAPVSSSKNASNGLDGFGSLKQALDTAFKSKEGVLVRRAVAALVFFIGYVLGTSFTKYCWRLSHDMSGPTIIVQGRLKNGGIVKIDDYRESYWWLRDNTPEDSRIMAWWDYGYQITGIANRTTIADGNTWNHEHIALLGMALTSPIEDGYEIARHLADYVLVWGGGGGDDLAKSPHLARIANSVYRHMCPGDPTCRAFGMVQTARGHSKPSPMMEKSLLYKLHGHKIKPNVEVDPDMFVEVFRSKYGKVRIFKVVGVSEESKYWVADRNNQLCDSGGWFCPGQYPPGLSNILAQKKDFAQLEDFNRADADEDYQKQYFEAMSDPKKAYRKAMEEQKKQEQEEQGQEGEVSNEQKQKKVDEIYNTWVDTEDTTLIWKIIKENQVDELKNWLSMDPTLAFVRSKDGRGPMWWAFEQRNEEITTILMKAGVPHNDRDAQGLTPVDLLKG